MKAKITAANAEGDEEILKEVTKEGGREELGVVGIFCGTWFRNLTDLNKHTNVMHDCGMKRLPPAVRVNNFTPGETRSAPASGTPIRGQQVIKF